MDDDKFIQIDETFMPFDFHSMIKKQMESTRSETFLPLNDPALTSLIQEHQAELEVTEERHRIFIPESDLEEIGTPEEIDPLGL